ncbi:MAG TPA: extracellular solute-binding protein [Clostridiales bacterium]|nr:extracellular solute-binding protein [Clostridiales bacterium]
MNRYDLKRKLLVLLIITLVSAICLSACSNTTSTGKQNGKTAEQNGSKEDGNVKTEPPAKISMFYQEAGQAFPDDFKHEDNWFINFLCEKANVEITELIVPTLTDAETKFSLLMSSGRIPDLIERFSITELKDYGTKGAFLPSLDIIKSSPNISRFFDDSQLRAMQSENGIAYIIPVLPANDDFSVMQARWDLLEKVGYKEPPDTLDEWVEACRKLKKYDPNSIPICSVGLNYAQFIFNPFNVGAGHGWNYFPERGKVSNVWEGDNIIKAVTFGKQLYEEGIWDKEFVTNSGTEYGQKKINNNVLVQYNNYGGYTVWLNRYIIEGKTDYRLIPTRQPMAEGVGIDQWYFAPTMLGPYAFAVSANTKEKEAVTRLLNVLYSDDVNMLSTYGREGIEYKVENGKKTPIFPAASESSWKSIYGWAFVNNGDKLNYLIPTYIHSSKMSDSEKLDYIELSSKATKKVKEISTGKLGYNPFAVADFIEEDLRNLATEVTEIQKSLITKAILNEISIDEFAVEKEKLVKKYQHITDAYNVVTEKSKTQYNIK